ncbi:16S rRNA (uracil(1498)-N(3))-methyltransferase [Flavobacterium aciduliphilum]|uniref:Ribosomal RNA small subunit methyltransferase E n=1 Tax=Flavobacterium aciduliphilum TaxID=1101402 RepID=A0A328YG66_9FLAO|nr:16S rRNA (uracil(1498)-N(3))-methyltransferase [Flavobacterium aciduliphilum]RAR72610.1 16S rRNA (uracil1498-N3)-methyltransferase [Flavobacterium aciduliphilum]
MQLFYNPTISEHQNSFVFDKDESKHIIKVLRKKEGDILYVTNGLGKLFTTEIILASDSKCTVKINDTTTQEAPKYRLHIAVAPTKMNERLEWFLEKATEIGIQEITPIICEHSERKVIKIERFEKIIESAMKQSLHSFLPKIHAPVSFKDFIKKIHAGQKFIAHCEDTPKNSLKTRLELGKDVLILIGPEGDFSVKEIEMALQHDFIPVSLGETRLRTETAALVACHSVVLLNES